MGIDRSDPDGADSEPRATAKACDICHSRKIKCDRKTPCSSCLSSHVTCKTSARPPEKRKRVTTASYENEVKSVSERLASLEKIIHSLAKDPTSIAKDDSSQRNNITRSSREVADDHNSPFDGASSFAAHSKQVRQAFGSIITATSTGFPSESPLNPGFRADLSNAETVEPIKDFYELPKVSLVLKAIRAAKTNPKKFFPGMSDLNITSLADMCQKVFFPIEDCSRAFVTVVIACLWELFSNFGECDLHQHGIDGLELERAKVICKRNLDDAVQCAASSSELSIPQTYEASTNRALSLFLLETSRPSLALSFISTCARLCQGAGYHCLKFDSSDSQAKQKIVIFWLVFSIDRGLSLNFGRSPSLQDYDVMASRPSLVESQKDRELFFCSVGVELAYLQGDVYKLLYSARAQSESTDIKADHARVLSDRMSSLRQQILLFETGNDVSFMHMIEGYDLLLQSHLALIYQAIPSTRGDSPLHFSDECIIASRAAMEGYNTAWEKYGSRDDTAWKTLINWTYLFSPFTAFIVLFGTVITLKKEADLKLMKASVKTLKSAAQYSPGISKLHDACDTFLKLASSYMAQTIEEGGPYSDQLHQQLPAEAFDVTSLSYQDWNEMLDDWELGLGGENAREISSFLTEGFFPSSEQP